MPTPEINEANVAAAISTILKTVAETKTVLDSTGQPNRFSDIDETHEPIELRHPLKPEDAALAAKRIDDAIALGKVAIVREIAALATELAPILPVVGPVVSKIAAIFARAV